MLLKGMQEHLGNMVIFFFSQGSEDQYEFPDISHKGDGGKWHSALCGFEDICGGVNI